MDLVSAAGIDVADWARSKRGAAGAAMNPKYCYEWCFVAPGELVVLNVWREDMGERGEAGALTVNPRATADRFRGVAGRSGWVGRATRTEAALALAHRDRLPVRVIVLDGKRRADDGVHASRVTARVLDDVAWHVAAYDANTGAATLVRGDRPVRFVDQFALRAERDVPSGTPERRTVSGTAFVRSAGVRAEALDRAQGCCEWCGERGFETQNGRVYLETHHVVPLAEGGPDSAANVTALCADDHRRAHFGAERLAMRPVLIGRIARLLNRS